MKLVVIFLGGVVKRVLIGEIVPVTPFTIKKQGPYTKRGLWLTRFTISRYPFIKGKLSLIDKALSMQIY